VFLENNEAVIVDYKTDYVQSGNALLERYGTQLRLYAHILAKSLNVAVKECVIYSFALSKAIAVESQ
jgi:ATP-dependent helicase/nuclease subunit A